MNKQILRLIIQIRDYKRVEDIVKECKKKQYDRLLERRLADFYKVHKKDKTLFCDTQEKLYVTVYQKLHEKKKLRVAFVLYSAAMWSCSELYNLMIADDRFDPYVIVAKYTNDSNRKTWPTFQMTQEFFKKRDIPYITVRDDVAKGRGWIEMGEPDIVFYLTPYHTLLPEEINQGYLPCKVLTVYIPYSYMLIKAEEKYDAPGFAYSWKHFCDSEAYRELLIKHNHLYKRNTFFVGYPKMDVFYEHKKYDEDLLWKNATGGKKKIIYAPHHSLRDLTYCSSHFSTFDKNYRFMLELAKKYSDTTTWIYKPHPNLKKTVIMAGVFESHEAYEDYLREWNELDNAKIVQEGTYADYFMTSDAMICDSVSFLAEYQFTGKPLLLLTRPEQAFNEFGDIIRNILYQCKGEDLKGIEQFVEDVVIRDKDYMKTQRMQFFDEKLDYFKKNKSTASKQIFDEICKACFD